MISSFGSLQKIMVIKPYYLIVEYQQNKTALNAYDALVKMQENDLQFKVIIVNDKDVYELYKNIEDDNYKNSSKLLELERTLKQIFPLENKKTTPEEDL